MQEKLATDYNLYSVYRFYKTFKLYLSSTTLNQDVDGVRMKWTDILHKTYEFKKLSKVYNKINVAVKILFDWSCVEKW